MSDTAKQEQGSIIAMYYAIDQGADLRPNMDLDLKNAILKKYPKMTNDWYLTFLEQAEVVKKYLNVQRSNTNYKYGWFDGGQNWANGVIPANKVTYAVTEIWDLFTREQRNVFGNKKDSWNTADVYIVKSSKERELMDIMKGIKETFGGPADPPELFAGTIKTAMSQAMKEGWLYPISLKKRTSGASVRIKETNLDDAPQGDIDISEAEMDMDPVTYFDIEDRGTLDFKGNSFKYKANFQVGSYRTKYQVEQRMQGAGSKTEVKDIVLTNAQKYKAADAQTGNVPIYRVEEIIEEYAGESYDHNIPAVGTDFTAAQKSYWMDYMEEIYNDTTFRTKKFGNLTIMGKKFTPKEFMDVAISIDSMTGPQVRSSYNVAKGDYSAKLRNKLRHLRFMKALINTKKTSPTGNGRFARLITEVYYRAAKMNIDESELIAPFIKVSS